MVVNRAIPIKVIFIFLLSDIIMDVKQTQG